jgi:hypothetical protein
MQVEDLYDAVKRRECILFLGAGAHYPPGTDSPNYQYPPEQRPPLGKQLSHMLTKECAQKMRESSRRVLVPRDDKDQRRRLAKKLRDEHAYLLKNRDELQRIAWFYEVQHQRQQLIDRVSQAVSGGKKPSAVVRALAEIDLPIVITTNYDRLYEQALGILAKDVSTTVYNPKRGVETAVLLGLPKKDERWLFKIHGCVSISESIVITDEDYIRFMMRMNDPGVFHPVPEKIRVQLAEWPTLFVGYSLFDYNLRVLFRTLRWRLSPAQRPPTFSLDLKPDILILATYGVLEGQLSRDPLVTFIPEDIWKFVPQLYKEILGKEMPP